MNVLHPIYYGNRALTKTEKNYSVYEKELLAIVYFTRFFKAYLMGRHLQVYMITVHFDIYCTSKKMRLHEFGDGNLLYFHMILIYIIDLERKM